MEKIKTAKKFGHITNIWVQFLANVHNRVDMFVKIHKDFLTQQRHIPMVNSTPIFFDTNYLWASEVFKNQNQNIGVEDSGILV